ncbi:MAG: hypothetical protein IJX88_05245 [Clostridia bacterium]|nr:hypothetical protein [Clostridia bacterium]
MKLRVWGTKPECEAALSYYRQLEEDPNVMYVQVSKLYGDRGSSKLFRLYIEVMYHSEPVLPMIEKDST